MITQLPLLRELDAGDAGVACVDERAGVGEFGTDVRDRARVEHEAGGHAGGTAAREGGRDHGRQVLGEADELPQCRVRRGVVVGGDDRDGDLTSGDGVVLLPGVW